MSEIDRIIEALRNSASWEVATTLQPAQAMAIVDEVTRLTAERDAARADADRLAEALKRFAKIDLTGRVGDEIVWDILNARATLGIHAGRGRDDAQARGGG